MIVKCPVRLRCYGAHIDRKRKQPKLSVAWADGGKHIPTQMVERIPYMPSR